MFSFRVDHHYLSRDPNTSKFPASHSPQQQTWNHEGKQVNTDCHNNSRVNNQAMDLDQDNLFLQMLTQALRDMEPDRMNPNEMEPDDMNTTPTTPFTPSKKRKARQGYGQYDSTGVSSPVESANAPSNINSPAAATPRAKRARGSTTESQLKQMFSSPRVATPQVSDQPQYLGANQSAQHTQPGYSQQSPLRPASAPPHQHAGVNLQASNQRALYSELSARMQASAHQSQFLGMNQQTGGWQGSPYRQSSTTQARYLGANQQVQPQQMGYSQQSPSQQASTAQPLFSGVNQQAHAQQIGYSQQLPSQQSSTAQPLFSGANQQAHAQQMGYSQQLPLKQAIAPQFPAVHQQAQQARNQQTGNLQQQQQQQQRPLNGTPTPQPQVPGRVTQQTQNQPIQEQHVRHQQVQQSHQQVQHQTAETLNQVGGDCNLFLRQQIIGTYQLTFHESTSKTTNLKRYRHGSRGLPGRRPRIRRQTRLYKRYRKPLRPKYPFQPNRFDHIQRQGQPTSEPKDPTQSRPGFHEGSPLLPTQALRERQLEDRESSYFVRADR